MGRKESETHSLPLSFMEIRESGPRNFISIDDISVSFMYMF